MKRRRGSRKGKQKKGRAVNTTESVPAVVNVSGEDNSGRDELENEEFDSGVEGETPSSTGAVDQQEKPATACVDSDAGLVANTAGRLVYHRVKVKIKTSKTLDSQHTSSDVPTRSDTDKSNQQVGLEKQGVLSEKMEDSANSLLESNVDVPAIPSRKSGGIKIKPRGTTSSTVAPCSNIDAAREDMTDAKDPKSNCQEPRSSEQELSAALEVIKKVMKMDAADPFNTPVNPVALGIPDYFDVIETPMDFGTICSNLESGTKYTNSEDVYKDVQYIWDNCYKYNNKGDYIVELMKRVRKNFMKYWMAAGLYCDQPQDANGDTAPMKIGTPSSQEAIPAQVGALLQTTKKRHGLKKHKEDCQCAICVMMRRRQEREEIARLMEDQTEVSYGSPDEELKIERASLVGSPSGGYTSSNMDNSPDLGADADMEVNRENVNLESTENPYRSMQEKHEKKSEDGMTIKRKNGDMSEEKHNRPPDHESGGPSSKHNRKDGLPSDADGETAASGPSNPKELLDRAQKAKLYENLRYLENPMLMELCSTLFSNKHKSAWSGPHSLVRSESSSRRSSLHAAMATFMK